MRLTRWSVFRAPARRGLPPAGREIIRGPAREAVPARSVRAHDEQVAPAVAVTLEYNPRAVRRPRAMAVVSAHACKPPHARAVDVHGEQVRGDLAERAREQDLLSVGRP